MSLSTCNLKFRGLKRWYSVLSLYGRLWMLLKGGYKERITVIAVARPIGISPLKEFFKYPINDGIWPKNALQRDESIHCLELHYGIGPQNIHVKDGPLNFDQLHLLTFGINTNWIPITSEIHSVNINSYLVKDRTRYIYVTSLAPRSFSKCDNTSLISLAL